MARIKEMSNIDSTNQGVNLDDRKLEMSNNDSTNQGVNLDDRKLKR